MRFDPAGLLMGMRVFFGLVLLGSGPAFPAQLKTGPWLGTLELDSGVVVPFNFDVAGRPGKTVLTIRNAEERIRVDEVTIRGDSLLIKMPVFDSEFKTRILGDSLAGRWFNHAKSDSVGAPFKAWFGRKNRFGLKADTGKTAFQGKWEVTFGPGSKDSSKAVGVFAQKPGYVKGTFLTETGDFRFLEGIQSENRLYLSCFDGAHAYLFRAKLDGGKIHEGDFFSHPSHHEKWVGKRNDGFSLSNPDSITRLKKEFDRIYFTFPDLEGKPVSLKDPRFENKVVIVQVMGSWCPNCMDETAYLSRFYRRFHSKGLEIVALAYERASDPARARNNVLRLKQRFAAEYVFLLTGLTGKSKASESLPALDRISAFPTTIYLDKRGKVRKVHTGFSGPATGREYEKFQQSHESFVAGLLREP